MIGSSVGPSVGIEWVGIEGVIGTSSVGPGGVNGYSVG